MSMKKNNLLRLSLSPLKNLVTRFYFFNSFRLAYLTTLRTLLVTAFFAGTLSFSALAQSAQLPGSCQAFFTGPSKELEKLFIQNRDTQNSSDILRSMDALIQNGEANPNEAFMLASLRSEEIILLHLKRNYELDSTAIIEYAFMKKISEKEIDNLILFLSKYSSFVVEKNEYVNQVLTQALINRDAKIASHLITNHEANINKAFLEIALRGDVETATYLLENYEVNIFYRATTGYADMHLTRFINTTGLFVENLTPLNIASSLGHKAFVEYLLKAERESFAERVHIVESRDTAFLIAITKGHTDTARVFIELNSLQNPLKTLKAALEIAKESSDTNMADFLIQEIIQLLDKQDPEETQRLVKSSFELATQKGLTEKTKLLIGRKELNIFDISWGLDIALENGHKDLAIFILQYLKDPSSKGLQMALYKGYRDIVQIYLFEKDFDTIMTIDNSFVKPLIELASRGELDILKDVFKAGYKNAEFLNTALPEVVLKSNLKERELVPVIDFLISQGVNIEGQNLSGDTALHVVASQGKSLLTDKLIEHKANTNARNNNKETPLHLAVTGGESFGANGNPKVVQSLINNGADLTAKDIHGKTALDRTKPRSFHYSGDNAVVILLKMEGNLELPYTNSTHPFLHNLSPLQHAIDQGNVELVADLVELGVNIHNLTNKTPKQANLKRALWLYHISLTSNSAKWEIENAEKIADILLEKADPNFRDENGESELMWVAESGNVRQLEDLINKGHDTKAKDKEGKSVTDYARSNINKDPALLKFLQERESKGNADLYQEASP